jgi:hypothetical protein
MKLLLKDLEVNEKITIDAALGMTSVRIWWLADMPEQWQSI